MKARAENQPRSDQSIAQCVSCSPACGTGTRNPDWEASEPWGPEVTSYAIDDGERPLLFDPLAVPAELVALAADRENRNRADSLLARARHAKPPRPDRRSAVRATARHAGRPDAEVRRHSGAGQSKAARTWPGFGPTTPARPTRTWREIDCRSHPKRVSAGHRQRSGVPGRRARDLGSRGEARSAVPSDPQRVSSQWMKLAGQ